VVWFCEPLRTKKLATEATWLPKARAVPSLASRKRRRDCWPVGKPTGASLHAGRPRPSEPRPTGEEPPAVTLRGPEEPCCHAGPARQCPLSTKTGNVRLTLPCPPRQFSLRLGRWRFPASRSGRVAAGASACAHARGAPGQCSRLTSPRLAAAPAHASAPAATAPRPRHLRLRVGGWGRQVQCQRRSAQVLVSLRPRQAPSENSPPISARPQWLLRHWQGGR
jgi:hypothetical protein